MGKNRKDTLITKKQLRLDEIAKDAPNKLKDETNQTDSLTELLDLLDIVNLVPIDVALPDPLRLFYQKLTRKGFESSEEYSGIWKSYNRFMGPTHDESLYGDLSYKLKLKDSSFFRVFEAEPYEKTCMLETWKEILEKIKCYKKLLKYFYSTDITIFSDDSTRLYRYFNYWVTRGKIKALVGSDRFGLDDNEVHSERRFIDHYPITLEVDSKGRVITAFDSVLKIMQGIDLWRLRVCPRCRLVYFADDLRRKYCSEKCRNAKNSKVFYANQENREKVLAKKMAAYHASKPATKADKKRESARLGRLAWQEQDFSKKGEIQ